MTPPMSRNTTSRPTRGILRNRPGGSRSAARRAHRESAERAVRLRRSERRPEPDRVVARAVAVRAPGRDQPETVGERGVVLALLWRVVAVVDLEPAHADRRHAIDQLVGDRRL